MQQRFRSQVATRGQDRNQPHIINTLYWVNAQNYVQCFRVTASVPNLIVKLMVSKIQSNVFDPFSSKMIRYILYRPGKNLIPSILGY